MSDSNGPYRAVSIESNGLDCCDVARDQSGTRYLCNEAPMLPLADCTNSQQCRCKYQHWNDRRQEDRRSPVFSMASQYFDGADRRTDNDRRSD
jgi:hypothetical protein